MDRRDQEDKISQQMNCILGLTKDSAHDEAGLSQFDHCPPNEAAKPYPRIVYEYNFVGLYLVRIIESEPGIVHFEQARIERGDPSIMRFERTEKPMGCANEILHLNERWMRAMARLESIAPLSEQQSP